MKLWYVGGEQDVPCMVTYVYELILLPGGVGGYGIRPHRLMVSCVWAGDRKRSINL